MPSENMLIWRICKRLSPIGEPWRKPPPFIVDMWGLLHPAKSGAILTLSSNQTAEKHGDIMLPPLTCNVNLILSVPLFDNALEINQRRNVLFDYIWPWTLISYMQFRLQICMSKVLSKKGKILPRDTQELVLSESLKRNSQGKWMYIWEIKNHLLWNSLWEMDRIRREIPKTSTLCPFSFHCICVSSSSFHMIVFISGRWEIPSALWGDRGKTHCSSGGIWLPYLCSEKPMDTTQSSL